MSDRVNQKKWNRKQSRVYGNGLSINCNNIITAETLQNTLNQYETTIHQLKTELTINTNYEKLKTQITALQMDLKVVQDDLDKIKELLQ